MREDKKKKKKKNIAMKQKLSCGVVWFFLVSPFLAPIKKPKKKLECSFVLLWMIVDHKSRDFFFFFFF